MELRELALKAISVPRPLRLFNSEEGDECERFITEEFDIRLKLLGVAYA